LLPLASSSLRRIYATVSRIPKGRVATYGQLAALAGLPRRARLVGHALRVLPADSPVPWHRVVNAQGKISPRGDLLGHEELQAHLLRREGVRLEGSALSLERYRWDTAGRAAAVAATAKKPPRGARTSAAGRRAR
jgi:methylated-DNA-protein-cysteine methyltransferase-like protein